MASITCSQTNFTAQFTSATNRVGYSSKLSNAMCPRQLPYLRRHSGLSRTKKTQITTSAIKLEQLTRIASALPKIDWPDLPGIILAVAIPLSLGFLVSRFVNPTSEWYLELEKPKWNPDPSIFAPVWTVLYTLIGFSSWLVFKQGGGFLSQGDNLKVYGVQLALNYLWPILFFGFKKIGFALANNTVLWIGVLSTIQGFRLVDKLAARLLYPYLAWVSFATILNYDIWRRNRSTQ